LPLVLDEPDTVNWYGLMGPSTLEFWYFETEKGRKAHLEGKIAEALMANAGTLFSKDPVIELVDLLAVK
jgi:hypothetical protein